MEAFSSRQSWEPLGGQQWILGRTAVGPEDSVLPTSYSRRICPPEHDFPEDISSGVAFPAGRYPPGAQPELFFINISITFVSNLKTSMKCNECNCRAAAFSARARPKLPGRENHHLRHPHPSGHPLSEVQEQQQQQQQQAPCQAPPWKALGK